MLRWCVAVALVALGGYGCAGQVAVVEPPTTQVVDEGPPTPHDLDRLKIPPGHLPPPGDCRVWFPGEPPGHQPPSGSCSELARNLPAGAWLIDRSVKHEVRIVECDPKVSGKIVSVKIYEAGSGLLVRNETR